MRQISYEEMLYVEGLYIEGCMLMPLLGGLILEMKKRISFPLTYFYLNFIFFIFVTLSI